MSDRLQITDLETGSSRSLDVRGQQCFVTLLASGDVELRDEAPGAVLRLVATASGYRIEPVAAGGAVVVNGEQLYCKDLARGDVILLGHQELVWVPGSRAAPPPPASAAASSRRAGAAGRVDRAAAAGRSGGAAAPASGSAPRSGAPRPSAPRSGVPRPGVQRAEAEPARGPRRRRSSGLPGFLVPGLVALGVLLGAVLLFQVLWDAQWPRTPQHFVDLARSQFSSGRTQEALATLDMVPAGAGAEARAAVAELRLQIEQALLALSVARDVRGAQADLDLLHGFADRFLAAADAGRPAARMFVRSCDDWLAANREACSRSDAGRELVAEVERLRLRWLPASELPDADRAADVLFAAEARLRFQVREYKAALTTLDQFLAVAAGDEARQVAAARDRMLAEGEAWLRERAEMVERMLERGERRRAQEHLLTLERRAVLPQWEPILAAVKARAQ